MHSATGSQNNDRSLDRIGEILAKAANLWLIAREEEVLSHRESESENLKAIDPLVTAAATRGSITTGEVISMSGMSRSTARRRLEHLVNTGQLVLNGKGRGANYQLAHTSNTKQRQGKR
jgi:predicted HTH transcriptional regulator